MRRALVSFLALTTVAVWSARAAQAEGSPAVTTTPCDLYPQVTCTDTDVASSADILQLAVDTREELAPLLKLGPVWRFPVHIHVVTPDDPLAATISRAGAVVVAAGKSLTLDAVVPSSDPAGREFVQRQLVTALLWEKYFAADRTFDTQTRLDVVPIWLVEGLREWLNEDPQHNRENVVRRSAQNGTAPTLAEVTGWRELSDDRLLGLWQRAFCYYLVSSLVQSGERRDDFQQWIATVSRPHPSDGRNLFPTEMGWQKALLRAPAESRDIVYTWDETAADLAAQETIVIPAKDSADTRLCTIDTAATFHRDDRLLGALRQKVYDLTSLELRAHPSWRPIVALYRFGLSAVIDGKNMPQALQLIEQARQQRVAEVTFHQNLVDYVNWFEVTKSYTGETSHFRAYFSTAQEMERMEADPSHPNPIRANLLHVESQL